MARVARRLIRSEDRYQRRWIGIRCDRGMDDRSQLALSLWASGGFEEVRKDRTYDIGKKKFGESVCECEGDSKQGGWQADRSSG